MTKKKTNKSRRIVEINPPAPKPKSKKKKEPKESNAEDTKVGILIDGSTIKWAGRLVAGKATSGQIVIQPDPEQGKMLTEWREEGGIFYIDDKGFRYRSKDVRSDAPIQTGELKGTNIKEGSIVGVDWAKDSEDIQKEATKALAKIYGVQGGGRRSGRTTRMILQSLLYALDNKDSQVWVFAHDGDYCRNFQQLFNDIAVTTRTLQGSLGQPRHSWVVGGSRVYFVSIQSNPETVRGRYVDETFWDHYLFDIPDYAQQLAIWQPVVVASQRERDDR